MHKRTQKIAQIRRECDSDRLELERKIQQQNDLLVDAHNACNTKEIQVCQYISFLFLFLFCFLIFLTNVTQIC